MAQHDYNIVNGNGRTVRNDMNNVLEAIVTNNSGSTPPEVKVPGTFWFDTSEPLTPGTLRIWLDDGEWHKIASGALYMPLTGGNIIGDLTVMGTFTNPGFNARRANYASGTAPTSPVNGQLWFNTTSKALKIWNATSNAWLDLVDTSSPVFTQMVNINASATTWSILNLTTGAENRRIYNDRAANDRLVFDGPAGATMIVADSGDTWLAGFGWIGAAINAKQAKLNLTPVRTVYPNEIAVGYWAPTGNARLWVDGVDQGALRLGRNVLLPAAATVGAYGRCTSIDPVIQGNQVVAGGNLRLGTDSSNAYPSGSWRNMGGRIGDKQMTLFQRIA